MKDSRKKISIKSLILSHIINNKKIYLIILLLFVIGIFLGVFFINNIQEEQYNNISNYINQFLEKLKSMENIDCISLLKNSLLQNTILAVALWFFGTTVIRNTNSFWTSYL